MNVKRKLRSMVLTTALAAGLLCAGCYGPVPGSSRECIVVDGWERTFLLHLPPDVDAKEKRALVIVLHPFTGTGKSMERLTGFSALAEEENFIVAYPDGHQRVWNADPVAPSSILGPPADDVTFIAALIDHLIGTCNVDTGRIYVAGASSGGLMTHRVGCALAGRLAAAASVMITLPEGWQDAEQLPEPLPFLMVQGTDDPFFPWQGGTVNQGLFRQSEYQRAEDSVAFWVRVNKALSPPVSITLPDVDPDDGTTVFRDIYAAGPGGVEVHFYGVNGGGHTWPGGAETWPKFLVGRTSRDIHATRIIWDFFKTHSRSSKQ
ncbi:MAG: hypothetical protein GXY07_05305 [Candidatus Hydrogenedentes bacterium]|nr:hypothetical protein [Candidatus Hydrogenedentota bacterium]